MADLSKPRLRLVHGGRCVEQEPHTPGPFERLNLNDRLEPIPTKVIAFMLFAKGALLASLLYYFFA